MNRDQILAEIQTVARGVFNNSELAIGHATTAKDVPEWDSITHIELIVAIEKRFKVKFTAKEIQSFANAGEICDTVARKRA